MDLVKQLRSPSFNGTVPCWIAEEAATELTSLRARIAELEADAERYRYLRRKGAFAENYLETKGGISAIFVSDGRIGHATDTEALDAAIDGLMLVSLPADGG